MNRGKAKVRGGIRKRFKLTGSGKIKRRRANHSHLLTKKNAERKRRLVSPALVDSSDEKRIKRLMKV